MLLRSDAIDKIGAERIFHTIDEAVRTLPLIRPA